MQFLQYLPAIASAASSLFGRGRNDKMKQFAQYTPQQSQFLQSMLQGLLGGQLGKGNQQSLNYLQELLNPSQESFERFADPYRREFSQQTIPNLAERFAGFGGGMGGGLSSSGFGQSLSSAAGNLQSQLAALKSALGQSASQQIMNQYGSQAGLGLGAQPFGYTYQPGNASGLQSFLSNYANAGFPGLGGFGKSPTGNNVSISGPLGNMKGML